MTQSDLLDVLIGAIILLVALIGLWQGIVRTLLYLCGAFLGSELALWWAGDIGDRLADWLPMSIGTGRFVASTALIVAAMVTVGACFGSLLWRYPADWRSRAGGLVAGIVLGLVTVGLVLRYNVLFLQSRANEAIGDTRLAWRLWEDFNLVIALSAVVLLVMVIAGWVLGPADQELTAASLDRGRSAPWESTPIQQPVRDQSQGGFETPGTFSSGSQPYAPPTPPARSQLDGLDDSVYAAPSINGPPRPESGPPASVDRSDSESGRGFSSDILRDDPEYGPHRSSATETVTFAAEGREDRRDAAGMCPNCGMLLKSGDAFCSNCGFPVES